jgi:signal transduction histidine kinase
MRPTRRVLLVEDNPHDRVVVAQHLAMDRHFENEVTAVETVEAALAAVEGTSPDAIILDQELTPSRGTDMLRELHRRGFSTLPILFLTGSRGPFERLSTEVLELGADDFLVKDDLTGPQLLRALGTAHIKARLRSELERSRAELHAAATRIARMQQLTAALGGATTGDTIAAAVFENLPLIAPIRGGALLLAGDGDVSIPRVDGCVRSIEGASAQALAPSSPLDRVLRGTMARLDLEDFDGAGLLALADDACQVPTALFALRTPDRDLGALILCLGDEPVDAATSALLMQTASLVSQALDRALIQEQLTRQLEFERRLIGVVSHDLRNPLSVCAMSVSLLQRDANLSVPSQRAAQKLRSAVRHMHLMVEQLLDITRIRSHSAFPISRTAADVCLLASQHIEELRSLHPEREIELFTRGDAMGYFDEAGLGQVISNLVGNALHYGRPDRVIRVEVQGLDTHVVLIVANHGPPIPQAKLPTLFEPFSRGDCGPQSENRGGLGLGLYITRGIVTAHGGEIEVLSEGDETVFTVRLPR